MSKAPPRRADAVTLLDDDHIAVSKLFDEYKKLHEANAAASKKQKVVTTICDELTVHMMLEEEVFYPATRGATGDDDLIDEGIVEHSGAKELIAQLREMSPEDDLYDAKVKVLGEQIDHHVGEEREKMFPEARKSELDLVALRAALEERKAQIKEGATA